MRIVLDVPDNKAQFALELLRSISFVRNAKPVDQAEITNPELIARIEAYETGRVQPTVLNLDDLKALIHA